MSIWQRDRVPGWRNRHALGVWLSTRHLTSAAFLPGQRERKKFVGGKPYWYTFDLALGANQTMETRQSCQDDFYAIAILISNSAGGAVSNPGSRIQVLDAVPNRPKRWSKFGPQDITFGGSAQHPFYLRRPYCFHAGTSILVRAQNLQAQSNTVQVAIYGVQER